MNNFSNSYTVVIIENETGVVYTSSEWECIVPTDDESENAKALYRAAAGTIAAIIARIGTANVTATVMAHPA